MEARIIIKLPIKVNILINLTRGLPVFLNLLRVIKYMMKAATAEMITGSIKRKKRRKPMFLRFRNVLKTKYNDFHLDCYWSSSLWYSDNTVPQAGTKCHFERGTRRNLLLYKG